MYGPDQIKFLKTQSYLHKDETMSERIASIVKELAPYDSAYSPGLSERAGQLLERGIMGLSTPQLANTGREEQKGVPEGLPCSCNIISPGNSIREIYTSHAEVAMLSKHGAGVGSGWDNIVDAGTKLAEGFFSNSVLDWIVGSVHAAQCVSQGATRRGYNAPYLSIDSPDFDKLMERVDKTSPFSKDPLLKNTYGVILEPGFNKKVLEDDVLLSRYLEVLEQRRAGGKAYLLHVDNCNRNQSPVYERLGHTVRLGNLCTEALTPSYSDMTFCCMLLSINATKWDEITDQDIADMFMVNDIFVSIYIEKASKIPYLEKAVRSATNKRDIGVGLLGFHDYLQQKNCAIGSLKSRRINREMFKRIREIGEQVTFDLGNRLGSPLLCRMAKMVRRNVSIMMVAPNMTTSFVYGNTSPGIGPYTSNYYLRKLAGGHFYCKNPHLEKILEGKGKNTFKVWDDIAANLGSVQHLDFLTDHQKEVFRTEAEISPKDLIDLASDRQEYIDMGQSLNLFNRPSYSIEDVFEIHQYGFEKNIKTYYYFHSPGHAGNTHGRNWGAWDDCVACAD